MKRCLPSLIITEMHLKTKMRYHLIHLRMVVFKNLEGKKSIAKEVVKLKPFCIGDWKVKWCCCCGKQFSGSSKCRTIIIISSSSSPNWYISRSPESRDSNTCTPIFMAALFPIAKWIDKIWYIRKIKYYSALKRNETLIHNTRWMNFANIMLSEISHTQLLEFPIRTPLTWGA